MSKSDVESLKKENQIFSVISGEYVVKAIYSFVHKDSLCFLMEFMHGGDLSHLLDKFKAFPELVARFYIGILFIIKVNKK